MKKTWKKICDGFLKRTGQPDSDWPRGGYVCSHYIANDGEVLRVIYGQEKPILKTLIPFNLSKYPAVNIMYKHNRKAMFIHSLLGKFFLKKPKGKTEINHKDGNKANYKLENLEWVTRSENQLHAYRTGLKKPYASVRRKLTKKQADEIREKFSFRYSISELAIKYSVHNRTIRRILNNETYVLR